MCVYIHIYIYIYIHTVTYTITYSFSDGAAAEVMSFVGLGEKVRPGTFGKIHLG